MKFWKRFLTISVLLNLLGCSSNDFGRTRVELLRCTDGDTAHFLVDGTDERVRFLAIDAPEIDTPEGRQSAAMACEILTNAAKIEIELDPASAERDRYQRLLAWVFVDGELLQKLLVAEKWAEIAYFNEDFRYAAELLEAAGRD